MKKEKEKELSEKDKGPCDCWLVCERCYCYYSEKGRSK